VFKLAFNSKSWRLGLARRRVVLDFDRRFGHSKRFEKSSTNLSPPYISLLAKPKQKDVGQEDMDRSVLKSPTGGQKHDQSQVLLALHNEVEFWMKTWKN
jgi:hypothetical protein